MRATPTLHRSHFGGHENLKTLALCEAFGVSSDTGRIVEPAKL